VARVLDQRLERATSPSSRTTCWSPRTDIAVPEENDDAPDRPLHEGLNRRWGHAVFLDGGKMAPDTYTLAGTADGGARGASPSCAMRPGARSSIATGASSWRGGAPPLAIEHIEAYLEKRGVEEAHRNMLAMMCWRHRGQDR
jgi:hypothetical protein